MRERREKKSEVRWEKRLERRVRRLRWRVDSRLVILDTMLVLEETDLKGWERERVVR